MPRQDQPRVLSLSVSLERMYSTLPACAYLFTLALAVVSQMQRQPPPPEISEEFTSVKPRAARAVEYIDACLRACNAPVAPLIIALWIFNNLISDPGAAHSASARTRTYYDFYNRVV